ncbi:hypothetical protein H6P81_002082 [Aristolochia fimbriata]|uniref:F-box domain-containing protein n=1 Tax=Aristolochia fimbriata TaxID=158543 RepID=A0AAV7F9C4_ARIFI|nr:hypothetical protein H6P81_002082 [Aristolochia fimbriata]
MEVVQGGGEECCYSGGEREQRPWSDLCTDVLLRILTFLPFVLDQLSFRGVCTFWRAAARQAPAAGEDQPQLEQRPWLLFTAGGDGENEEKQKKVRLLLDPKTRRTYRMEQYWPERVVEGAVCVASRHGWLLYHSPPQSRLFFFNPFSGATIDLPYIESISPASFDGHPTDDECVVIGIYQTHPHEIIICYCGRGDAYWTLARCRTFWSWGPFTHAVSCNHLFCFMDPCGRLFVFNFLKFSTIECRGPPLNFDSFRVAYLLVSHLRVYAAFVDVHTGAVCVFLMRPAGMILSGSNLDGLNPLRYTTGF